MSRLKVTCPSGHVLKIPSAGHPLLNQPSILKTSDQSAFGILQQILKNFLVSPGEVLESLVTKEALSGVAPKPPIIQCSRSFSMRRRSDPFFRQRAFKLRGKFRIGPFKSALERAPLLKI